MCNYELVSKIKELLSSEINIFILREKDLCASEYLLLAEKIIDIVKPTDKMLMLHTYKDVAYKLNWPYIHLTFNDFLSLSAEDKNYFKCIGVSTHSLDEAIIAEQNNADYITASHIFETSCKADLAPKGLCFLKNICSNISIPVYALGGINNSNYKKCLEAGADGICMMSHYMKGEQ